MIAFIVLGVLVGAGIAAYLFDYFCSKSKKESAPKIPKKISSV